MCILKETEPKEVFKLFEEISAIPRGSGNMTAIADYCVQFAENHSLKYIRDKADNVIIFKNGTRGYENAQPVILQGHLDMVCQKTADCDIDFTKDGLSLFTEGDFVKAKNTTLGADNGIAVAMVLSILASDSIVHPPIEAVFTTDEEVGMDGAIAVDTSVLKSTRMINIDSEEMDTVTVSCAGGSDFKAFIPFERETATGTRVKVTLNGLKGGHSGICINKGRQNSNILAGRFLNFAFNNITDLRLISVNGGDKGNAIPPCTEISLCCENALEFKVKSEEYLSTLKEENSFREPDFTFNIEILETGEHPCIDRKSTEKIAFSLLFAPNGVVEMSAEIENLVETSLNLGVLSTEENEVFLNFALRSNKKSALLFLEEKLQAFFKALSAKAETGGHYPPWEFNSNSALQEIYKTAYTEQFGIEPKVEAIHAGLECGVFADKIKNFDCIAIGPFIYDAHTVNERLSISSTEKMYALLISILSKLH